MREAFRGAMAALPSAQKSPRGISYYSRFVNRPAGRVLATAAYTLGLSPNLVTFLSALSTASGLTVLVFDAPSVGRGVAVALLLALGFALDSADGQVARLMNRASNAGQWLDHVVDAGKIIAVHASVLVFAFRFLDLPAGLLVVPLLFQIVSSLIFFGGELFIVLAPSDPAAGSTPRYSRLRMIALLPADYGVLAISFILLGWTDLFVPVYGLLFLANAVIAAILLRKWFRALSSAQT